MSEESKEPSIDEITSDEQQEVRTETSAAEISDEYLPTEEEETVLTSPIDDVSLDVMVSIGDILRGAVRGEISPEDAVSRIKEIRERLIRRVSAKTGRRRRRK